MHPVALLRYKSPKTKRNGLTYMCPAFHPTMWPSSSILTPKSLWLSPTEDSTALGNPSQASTLVATPKLTTRNASKAISPERARTLHEHRRAVVSPTREALGASRKQQGGHPAQSARRDLRRTQDMLRAWAINNQSHAAAMMHTRRQKHGFGHGTRYTDLVFAVDLARGCDGRSVPRGGWELSLRRAHQLRVPVPCLSKRSRVLDEGQLPMRPMVLHVSENVAALSV